MLVYIFLLIVLGFAATLYSCKTTANTSINISSPARCNKLLILCALLLILVSAFRSFSVGFDTQTYADYFNSKSHDPTLINFEKAFETAYLLLIKLNLDFTVFLLIFNIFLIFVFIYIIKKYSINPIMSIYLIVSLAILTNSFNGTRQYIACAFFLLSLPSLQNGNVFKYLFFVLCAYLFHNSALMLIPIYFVRYFKLNKKFFLFTIISGILALILMDNIIMFVSRYTTINYYERYVLTQILNESISLYNIAYIAGLIFVFLVLLYGQNFIQKSNKLSDKFKSNYQFLLKIFYLSVFIRTLATFSGIFSLINRFSVYFFFPIVILIPNLIYAFVKINLQKFANITVVLIGFMYLIGSVFVRKTNGVFPYDFIWSSNLLLSLVFYISILLLAITLIILSINFHKENNLPSISFTNKRQELPSSS